MSIRDVHPSFALGQLENLCFFHTNQRLGTLDFTGSEHWAPLEHSLGLWLLSFSNYDIVYTSCIKY